MLKSTTYTDFKEDKVNESANAAYSYVRLWKLDTRKKNEETRLETFKMKGLKYILRVSWAAKKAMSGLSRVKKELLDSVKPRNLKVNREETRALPGERNNNSGNNTRCTQTRKTTHCMDRQHQDMGRIPCGRVNPIDKRIVVNGESTSLVWPPLYRGRLKNS